VSNWSFTKFKQPYILVFLLLYAFIVCLERGGSSFHWNIGSCLPKYGVSLLKISQSMSCSFSSA